jgi:hypothetical protein
VYEVVFTPGLKASPSRTVAVRSTVRKPVWATVCPTSPLWPLMTALSKLGLLMFVGLLNTQ